jgi:hypothetical protein
MKKNINNKYFILYIFPLLFAVVGSLIATLITYSISTPATAWESFISQSTIICALIGYILGNAFVAHKIYGEHYELLQIINSFINEFPKPFKEYALRNINKSFRTIDYKISSLSHGGLPNQTFGQKIQIVESLIEDLGHGLKRYWATTLDKPSQMMKVDRFLDLQERTLKNVDDKKRIVVTNKDCLQKEIIENTDDLKEFIDWHIRNKFELLFLIDDENKFIDETKQFLDHLENDEVVSDFAILGNEWVYGEVKHSSNGVLDFNHPSRLLRLFGSIKSGSDIVKDYIALFLDLWDLWKAPKWAYLTSEQVRSECTREKRKSNAISDTVSYYNSIVEDTTPDLFFSSITQIINDSVEKIIAVDIAPIKSDISDWIYKPEYEIWMNATENAAKNGAFASRIYILKSPINSLADQIFIIEKIFKRQIDSGVNIWLVGANVLCKNKIPFHDFILIDDKICFSLGWSESFNINELNLRKNLDNPKCFPWYENIFNNIKKSQESRCINKMSTEMVMNYLNSLNWS